MTVTESFTLKAFAIELQTLGSLARTAFVVVVVFECAYAWGGVVIHLNFGVGVNRFFLRM